MIDAIFHVINFIVLCIVVRYVFKRYFYERIAQAMIMAQTAYANVLKRNEQLRKQEQGLIRAYYHQNYRYEELSRKTELWNHKIEQDYQDQAKQREAMLQQLDQRICDQRRYLHSVQLSSLVVEKVISEAQQELATKLSEHQAQLYTERMIAKIMRKYHVQ